MLLLFILFFLVLYKIREAFLVLGIKFLVFIMFIIC